MNFELFSLSGKVALVTGGNSGLGFTYAKALADAGGDVVIWGRRNQKNAEAAKILEARGIRVLAQTVDVRDERQVSEGMAKAIAEMGRIDCVIANAGIQSRPPSFHELDSRMYHELLATNQHGAFYTLREGVRHMVERAEHNDPGGSLIVCGSMAAVRGVARIEHYAAAKGALAAMIRCIAVEYGPYGVRANMVAPGYIDSNLPGKDPAMVAWLDDVLAKNPIPRAGRPEDVAGVVVYLASNASQYHTGDLIVVDGGMAINL